MTPEQYAEIKDLHRNPHSTHGDLRECIGDLLTAYEELLGRRERLKLPTTIDLPHRQQRADMLTAHILHLITPYLSDDRDIQARRDASRVLHEAFYTSGVEVITDADRQRAGLAPRNSMGVTAKELAIFENRRLEAMLRPMPMFIIPAPLPGGSET